jgi:hypothetical protein
VKHKKTKQSLGGPCGSWTPSGKVRAAQPWKVHTPRSQWFGPVTVTRVEVAA